MTINSKMSIQDFAIAVAQALHKSGIEDPGFAPQRPLTQLLGFALPLPWAQQDGTEYINLLSRIMSSNPKSLLATDYLAFTYISGYSKIDSLKTMASTFGIPNKKIILEDGGDQSLAPMERDIKALEAEVYWIWQSASKSWEFQDANIRAVNARLNQ